MLNGNGKLSSVSTTNVCRRDGDVLACVASVSNRVIARKLEREQKKKGGRGRGRGEEETLARKPHNSGKRPLIFQTTPGLPDL